MGRKDVEEKAYFNDVLRFADVCNGILFQGNEKILPNELDEADTELYFSDKRMHVSVRVDGMRYWKKQGINLALIAVEHQSVTDYHMVFRNMLTESLAYYRQWKQNKRRYSKEYRKWLGKMFRLHGSKEFLSGMKREDKFIPVILVVINWSGEKWDGATSLHEMLQIPDELSQFVNNYKLNIFDYHDYEDFSAFKTDVRAVFEALKNAGNEEKMSDVFRRFPKVEMETARLIETFLKIRFDDKYIITSEDGKEWLEMCKAWEDHFKSGRKEGIAIGIEQGIEQTLLLLVRKKIKRNLTLDVIAEELEEDIEVIRPIYEKAKTQSTLK